MYSNWTTILPFVVSISAKIPTVGLAVAGTAFCYSSFCFLTTGVFFLFVQNLMKFLKGINKEI